MKNLLTNFSLLPARLRNKMALGMFLMLFTYLIPIRMGMEGGRMIQAALVLTALYSAFASLTLWEMIYQINTRTTDSK